MIVLEKSFTGFHWLILGFLFFTLVFLILHLNEKSQRFNPGDLGLHLRPSALWPDLAALSLEELGQAVSLRRRDAGFKVYPGNEARVFWHGERVKTKLCVVYIHGWSASPHENLDAVQRMATSLGANLFVQRLSGHGGATQGEHKVKSSYEPDAGAQMLNEASQKRLFEDAFDAAHIGLRLGDRLVLVGSSTGGALCSFMACRWSQRAEKVAALVGCSCAFSVAIPLYPVVSTLFAWLRTALPTATGKAASKALIELLAGGALRDLPPMNEEHAKRSTLIYPTAAVPTCFSAIWEAGCLDVKRELKCPSLFMGSPKDKTVHWSTTVNMYEKVCGVPKLLLTLAPNDVDHQHVIGSRLQSPGYLDEVAATMTSFVSTYQDFTASEKSDLKKNQSTPEAAAAAAAPVAAAPVAAAAAKKDK